MSLLIPLIAVSLSMDAFSLSLAYGTLNISKKNQLTLSLIVGIYHFFMPILGMKIGLFILKTLPIKPDFVIFFVLTFIGIQMLIESLKENRNMNIMNFIELLIFGLAVSIDSFSVGIGLLAITSKWLISSLFFSLSAFLFTFLGLQLGKKLNDKFGNVSTMLGGIMLLIIGLFTLLH